MHEERSQSYSKARHGLVFLDLRSASEIESAIIGLRMIDLCGWYPRLLGRGRIHDYDLLTLVGLEDDSDRDGDLTVGMLRTAFSQRRRMLELKTLRRPDALDRNIAKVGNFLRLDATARKVLRLAVITTRNSRFNDLFRYALKDPNDLPRCIAELTGCSLRKVQGALDETSILRQSSFLVGGGWDDAVNSSLLTVDSDALAVLQRPRFDESTFLRRLVRKSPAPLLGMDDFDYVAEKDLIERYLRHCLSRRQHGANILLHGAPGTGKTEFVRAIGAAIGAELSEVPNENREGEAISGTRRFGAYRACQNLLGHRRRQLLLFDEVEDVFGSVASNDDAIAAFNQRRSRDPDSLRKSWINETLESNRVPSIWVCNQIGMLDDAYLRRFDMVVKFGMPCRSVRRRVIGRYFAPGQISPACAERLATVESLSPARVERAARVVRALRSGNLARRDREVERIVKGTLQISGKLFKTGDAIPEYYDPTFLNADLDISQIASGLKRNSNARLCFYGVPGTGKTAFAHHLARELDRPLLMRRGSDLLGMYVGETEKHIRRAFEQAAQDGAVLLIDEADSFLRDRSGATRSWEVTQVNELLTQMEAFDGIFVASTNLIDTLDDASLRRFDFKIRFDALTREQRRGMLRRICESNGDTSAQFDAAAASIDALINLTPGDFSNVLRQLDVTGQPRSAAAIVTLLAAEAGMKRNARQRPIGFVTA